MNNKIFYWSPFIDKVATVKSVINSAHSLAKYDKNYKPVILNTLGEWNDYKEELYNKNINLEYLTDLNLLNNRKNKSGFLKSRMLYFHIIYKLIYPCFKFFKKNTDNYLMIHLITSLPLILSIFIKKKPKIILRVSGLPKFNIFRKFLWKIALRNVHIIFCPTQATKIHLNKMFNGNKKKIFLLRDPIINVSEIKSKIVQQEKVFEKNYCVSIGRLTKQKNHLFLLKAIKKLYDQQKIDKKIFIIGEGERKKDLEKFIFENDLHNLVKIIGFKKNIFPILSNAEALISVSLWEDPGFTLVEAGYVNTNVISSDCQNGPQEILDYGKNGYLFKTNSIDDFIDKYLKFQNNSKKINNEKKLKLKKVVKHFTLFRHYNTFVKNLNVIQ